MNKSTKIFFANIPGIPFLWVIFKKIRAYPIFFRDFFRYKKLDADQRFPARFLNMAPQLLDKTNTTRFEPHYTYHPAWAARVLAQTRPKKHVDISSYLPFSTLVSAFVPFEFYDLRPAAVKLDGLACQTGDLMALPFADNSVGSLSCMHTIEHIGLGRYGDEIDPDGDIKAAKELTRVLAVGGNFLFVAPMGSSELLFNAHRRYSYQNVLNLFPNLRIKEFSLIPDNYEETGIISHADPKLVATQFDACGCFWFTKDE